MAGSDQYSVWNADSNGNYTSLIISAASGKSAALESFETSFHQDLNGDGTIGAAGVAVQSGGSLELTSSETESVTFIGSTGSLKLDAGSRLDGQIFGFTGDGTLSGSDRIDLSGLNYNSTVASSSAYNSSTGLLEVSNGASVVDLHFFGSYVLADFKFASDGNGGTIVYDPPVAANGAKDAAGSNSAVSDASSRLAAESGSGQHNFLFKPNFVQSAAANFASGIETRETVVIPESTGN